MYGCLKDRAGQGRAGVTRGHQGSLSGPREWCLCVCVCQGPITQLNGHCPSGPWARRLALPVDC